MSRTRWWLSLVAAALGLMLAPAGAQAVSPSSTFSLGIVDDGLFLASPPSVSAPWLSRAQALGSRYVRLDPIWAQIAPANLPPGFQASNPADPHYNFAALDSSIRALTARGQTVILNLHLAPTWAEGPNKPPASVMPFVGAWDPNAADFGAFAHAVAARYSGHFPDPADPSRKLPRVHVFQAWNEPNLPQYLMPQWSRANSKSPWQATSPVIYRRLLNAFYAGVKRVQPTATVLAAGTAPYGDAPATGSGRMKPVTFWRGLFCLNSRCSDPPHLNGLDHHPYGPTPTAGTYWPGDVNSPDLGRIWSAVHQAQRQHTILPAGPKSLWVTEIDWEDGPPNSRAIQARYLALSFYEYWEQGVSVVCWFELRDPSTSYATFPGAGLYDIHGHAKPVTSAYRFPFAAVAGGGHMATLWGKAPTHGWVAVQRWTGRSWRTIARLRTRASNIFDARHKLTGHPRLRAVIGRWASLPYTL